MSEGRLKDNEAKAVLKRWPRRTNSLWPTPRPAEYWLRAHPKEGRATCPSIGAPATANFHTHPDGMWIYFNFRDRYADIMTVEVCGSEQNFYDKRSRNYPLSASLILYCTRKWLIEPISVQGGTRVARWDASGCFSLEPPEDLVLPVRNVRSLLSLRNDLYSKFRRQCPPGHEFYCRHSSLGTYNSRPMQAFLKRMTFDDHFRTKR